MKAFSLSEGVDRTRVTLETKPIGDDLVVFLSNENGHIGAVAVAEYSREEKRVSTSVITRLGHKDDHVAHMAAQRLCRHLKRPVCAIAGIHLDAITKEEIEQIVQNCERAVSRLSEMLSGPPPAGSELSRTAGDS